MKTKALLTVLATLVGAGMAMAEQKSGQVQGTVDDQRVIQDRSNQQHLILRVQPQDARQGTYKFVDLGDPADLTSQNIRISQGDQIAVTGQQDQLDGRSVFAAEQITLEGQRYTLQQTSQQKAQTRERTSPSGGQLTYKERQEQRR